MQSVLPYVLFSHKKKRALSFFFMDLQVLTFDTMGCSCSGILMYNFIATAEKTCMFMYGFKSNSIKLWKSTQPSSLYTASAWLF